MVVYTPTLLAKEHMEVLEKGLNFSSDTSFDLFETLLDVNRFVRLLMIKIHFHSGMMMLEKKIVSGSY